MVARYCITYASADELVENICTETLSKETTAIHFSCLTPNTRVEAEYIRIVQPQYVSLGSLRFSQRHSPSPSPQSMQPPHVSHELQALS